MTPEPDAVDLPPVRVPDCELQGLLRAVPVRHSTDAVLLSFARASARLRRHADWRPCFLQTAWRPIRTSAPTAVEPPAIRASVTESSPDAQTHPDHPN